MTIDDALICEHLFVGEQNWPEWLLLEETLRIRTRFICSSRFILPDHISDRLSFWPSGAWTFRDFGEQSAKEVQIVLQNAPRGGSTDAKMLSAATIRHVWVLGNADSDLFNQFIGHWWRFSTIPCSTKFDIKRRIVLYHLFCINVLVNALRTERLTLQVWSNFFIILNNMGTD